MHHDAVIIGGGFAGIAAAVKLADAGLRVALVEKKAFLGGRAYSITDRKTGDRVDNGQHVLMGCYHQTFELLNTLQTQAGIALQPKLEVRYRGPDGFSDTLACPGLPGPFHLVAGLFGMKNLSWQDRWAALRFGLRLRMPKAVKESETVQQFYIRSHQPEGLTKRLWTPIVISALNEKPELADMGIFHEVLKQAFFGNAADSRLGLPIAPLQSLHGEKAIHFIESRGGRVLLNQTVESLEANEHLISKVMLSKAEPLTCNTCICATPAPVTKKLMHVSGLEEQVSIPELGSSPILSVYVWFEQSFSEDTVVCLEGCTFEWIFHRNNFMNPGEHKNYCVCLVLSAARDYSAMPRQELIQKAIDDVYAVYPRAKEQTPLSSMVFWEPRATFSVTPEYNRQRPGTITSISNLYLAGDWIATGLPATIEGAVQSGNNAAALVLSKQ